MKTKNIKKLIIGLAFIAVAAIAAWNVSENSNKYGLSDLSLANVEALANREGSSDSVTCYSVFSECWIFGCSKIYRCGMPCVDERADHWSEPGICR